MAEPMSATPLRSTPQPTPRPKSSKVSASWVVMLLAGLLAFVLYIAIARPPADKVSVAIARTSISPSDPFTDEFISYREIDLDPEQAKHLITEEKAEAMKKNGSLASDAIAKGALLSEADFEKPSSANVPLTMSVEVEPSRAVAGGLTVGDRVAIVKTESDQPAVYVASNVKVVDIDDGSSSSSGGGYSITLAVDQETALNIAAVVSGGDFHVIRTTGSEDIPIVGSTFQATAATTTTVGG